MPKQKNFYKQQQQQQKQKERQAQRQLKQSLKKQRNQARSLKGYAKHFQEFESEMNQLGLQIRDVEGDGNCLFRAIADALQGSERFHKKYRQLAVEVMEQKADFYSLFIEDDITFRDYLKEMSKDGEWGGNLELSAIASELDINFFIHMKGRPAMIITSMDDDRPRNEILQKKAVHLAYHLVENIAEHYSSVRMMGDDKQEPSQEISLDLFEGLVDNMEVVQNSDVDKIDDIDLEGAEFENAEEEEYMRQYLQSLKAQKEAKQQEEQFYQKQEEGNYQLKQKKNQKCKCGSKKTYKDCCMQKDILQQQQPQQAQPKANEKANGEAQSKKQAVFI